MSIEHEHIIKNSTESSSAAAVAASAFTRSTSDGDDDAEGAPPFELRSVVPSVGIGGAPMAAEARRRRFADAGSSRRRSGTSRCCLIEACL